MTTDSSSTSELSGKRVLITGGLGFIGSSLANRCAAMGARVTIYDFLDPKSGGNMHNVSAIVGDVEIVVNDIRSFEGVAAAVRGKDILFSCAAYTSHPNSMREPLLDIEVNCKGTINLLESCRRFNPEVKFVHVGTSTQIGRMQHSPVDELHPEFPVDIYSANKSASEKYVLIYASAHGLRATVVRLANTYGPRSNIKSPEFGFMNYFIGLALQGRKLTVYGDGAQLRNVTFIDDSVEALLCAALRPESTGEAYFAVSDLQHSVAEIATAIATYVGGGVRFVEWPKERAAIEIGDAVISNNKIRAALDWAPRIELPEGLTSTRDYFVSVLDKYL